MTTITIPAPTITKKTLIAVPRDVYGEFLAWQRVVKSQKTFTPTVAEKKALLRARKNLAKNSYVTLAQLHHTLGRDY